MSPASPTKVPTGSKCSLVTQSPHHEGSAGPSEGIGSVEEGVLAEDAEFPLPDLHDEFLERVLPGIELDDLDAVQDLAQEFDASILLAHLLDLQEESIGKGQEREKEL